jgi:hypothetical protein
MRRSAVAIVITVLVAAGGARAIAAHGRSPQRTARLAYVRPDGEPVPADDGEEHEVILASGCGVERWPVKTGTDADRFKVNTTPISTTIQYLGSRAKPSSYPTSHRVTTYELHTYQVKATVTQYKVEADSDIHLVLKDSAGRSMIAEIPKPTCVGSTSRWRTSIASARTTWTSHYTTTTSWHYLHRSVTLRGLGFFDVPHGQTGRAPNAIELHPVIYVHLN